jgi:hypothetical protein
MRHDTTQVTQINTANVDRHDGISTARLYYFDASLVSDKLRAQDFIMNNIHVSS